MSFCRKGAKWLDGLRIFFMTSGWRKVVQIKEMNFWGVEKSKGTWCEMEYEGQEEEEEVFWGAKEEKRKRPSTEHRRGKMVSKATSKFGGGSFLRSRKGNGFLREPEGQGSSERREGVSPPPPMPNRGSPLICHCQTVHLGPMSSLGINKLGLTLVWHRTQVQVTMPKRVATSHASVLY